MLAAAEHPAFGIPGMQKGCMVILLHIFNLHERCLGNAGLNIVFQTTEGLLGISELELLFTALAKKNLQIQIQHIRLSDAPHSRLGALGADDPTKAAWRRIGSLHLLFSPSMVDVDSPRHVDDWPYKVIILPSSRHWLVCFGLFSLSFDRPQRRRACTASSCLLLFRSWGSVLNTFTPPINIV